VELERLVEACGVNFIRVTDPYDLPAFVATLKEADAFARSPEGGVAVVIARHPCMLDRKAREGQPVYAMEVTEDCIACGHCLDDFECPGLTRSEADGRAAIDATRCIGCGVCAHVCPQGAIVGVRRGA
jgi:indolepyruvate ferredoxin oxidoreductase alpha subunit